MDTGRLMGALRRRRWLILLGVASCTLLTGFAASRMKREYLAAATLMPQERAMGSTRELSRPAEAEMELEDLTGRQDRLKTVSAIVSSPSVLGKVIEDRKMKTTPAQLSDQIEVKEVTSQILRVSYKDENPEQASAVVNGIADTFVKFYTELRSQEARTQVETLEKERVAADRELRDASSRLERFKRSGNISSLPDQMKVGLERAGQIEEARNTAEARLREVSAQVESTSAALDRTPAVREIRKSGPQTRLLEQLRLDVASLQRSLDRELGSHTEEHPQVQRLRKELKDAQQRLATETARPDVTVERVPNPDREILSAQLRSLRSERDGLAARVASLNVDLSRIQSQVSGFAGKDVELNLLTQRYALAEQRMTTIMGRLGQLRNAATMISSGTPIAIVDRSGGSNPPFDLSTGRTLRLTALAFVMSLALCVALAVGLDLADRRVKTVRDAEELTALPVVSVVPRLPGRASAANLCLTTDHDPGSHLAESYHFLANHVLRQTMHRENTTLMAATARPGQGATTALTNLAVALARAGRRVLLVEADLRRPFLHQVFAAEHKPGLTDVLQSDAGLDAALAETHVDNLSILPAGSTVRDPWSLLWQPRMTTLVEELRERFDYVLFNVPSATVFADALCIAPHVDGAILVMKTAEMPSGAEQKVHSWLDEVQVPVMGVVLNGVPAKEMETHEFHRAYTARPASEPRELPMPAPALPPLRRAA